MLRDHIHSVRAELSIWPRHPLIYEINAWAWLDELSRRHRHPLTLDSVPAEEWESVGGLGVDAVWLMGVWERSPAGVLIAREMNELQPGFKAALPDFVPGDVVGSPYSVHRYVVDEHLGGSRGLAVARSMLARRGIRLVLDFVPNHTARDHPWVSAHPEFYIRGTAQDLRQAPGHFFETNGAVIANGRDPYFPPWTDTAQLDAFCPGQRHAAVDTLLDRAKQCDGVRCDMAMLVINRVFGETWRSLAGEQPEKDYWRYVIPEVRRVNPGFLFLAETYWDLEWELQQQGTDYCYDKRLYDRLVRGNAQSIRQHLGAESSFQNRLVRFIENHDEPRAAQVFPPQRHRAAAVLSLSLPGAKLIHEGQLDGRKSRLPVQLGRRRPEHPDPEIRAFYRKLLTAIGALRSESSEWRLCPVEGWPDNQSCRRIIAWCWSGRGSLTAIAVNFSGEPAQGRVRLPWPELGDHDLALTDAFSGEVYRRAGRDVTNNGMFVDLPAWGFHFLSVSIVG